MGLISKVGRRPLRGVIRRKVLKKSTRHSRIPGIAQLKKGSAMDQSPLQRWEKAMNRRVDQKKIPGYSACVIHKGNVVHVSEYGYSDIERKTRFTRDSIVRLYCVTKSVVAVSVLILYERGLLRLTDPVSKYLPGWSKKQVVRHGNCADDVSPDAPNVANKVTILRLLTHTGGAGYGADFGDICSDGPSKMLEPLMAAVEDRSVSTLETFVNELSKMPLRHQPAENLNYSLGHDIVARIVEVVSGKTLDQFFETEVFRPLGMHDTGFFVPKRKASRFAALYGNKKRAARMAEIYGWDTAAWPKPSGPLLHRVDGFHPSDSNWIEGQHVPVFSGNGILSHNSGGLVSTLSDQARFFTMILNGGVLGDTRILQAFTVETWLFTDLLPLPGVRGKPRGTGGPWSGWSALGEVGMQRKKRDPTPTSDEYEQGQVAMGGVANTIWSVNPVRDMVTLCFTNAIDSELWKPDLVKGTVSEKGKMAKATRICPANFAVATRAVASRDAISASLRRESLSRTCKRKH